MSSPFIDIGLKLGESDAASELSQWAGRRYTVMDEYAGANAASGPGLRTTLLKTVMLVKNVSGVVLLPAMAVTPKAGKNFKEVDGYARLLSSDGKITFVVDEHYKTAGVPANDFFFVTVEGPTELVTAVEANEGNSIGEGSALAAQTAAASTISTTAGRVKLAEYLFASYAGATTPQVKALAGAFATALSAKTTANTDVRILAYMKSRWI